MPIGRGLSSLIPPQKREQDQIGEISLSPKPPQADLPAGRQGGHGSSLYVPTTAQRGQASELSRSQSDRGSAIKSGLDERSGLRKRENSSISSKNDSIFHIEVEKIKPNPFQPRSEFNNEGIEELAQSIREFGIIQPLVVSKIFKETATGTDVEYQLIAGERRLRAAKVAGLERVPAIVKKVDTNRTKLEIALIENLQRYNLNPIESAKAYSRLQDEFGLTQKEIAIRVGKSRESVANAMRLLNLPSYIQEALIEGKLNESQARALLGIQNLDDQRRIFENILANKLSVRAAKNESQKTEPPNPEIIYWQKRLEEGLGTPVKIIKNGNKGRVAIEFYSDEEWHGVLEKLLGPESGQ